jgi:hypothetical protein
MRTVFRQPGFRFLSAVVAICVALGICAAAGFAQKKTNAKRAATTKKAAGTPAAKTRAATAKTRATTEPEIQLERLPPDPSVENADVSITANVRARSLTFEVVPNPTVEFTGKPARDTVWEAKRENLPTPVQPGVTYRNIGIRLKITSVFSDIDRIVAEALGEIPESDDKPREAPAKSSADSKAAAPELKPATVTPPKERK